MKLYLRVVLFLCLALNNVKQVKANEDPFKKILEGNNNNNRIILGYVDLGANGHGGHDDIVGNRRSNILNGGAGNDTIAAHDGDDIIYGGSGNDKILAHDGNDIITPGTGEDNVLGGKGIDTVIYKDKFYRSTNIRAFHNNHILKIDDEDTLLGIEFIQFADVKINVKTLEIVSSN
ncbi:MAG: hypothetical protein AAF383_27035 [Cyanobacteria bacterium P01_A01_bin.83]